MQTGTRQKIREQYSRGGDEYDQVRLADPRGALLSDHDIRLFQRIFPGRDKAQPVLEIGAGTGRFTLPLLEANYTVIATDINEAMLEVLRRKVLEQGFTDRCEIARADVFRLPFEDGRFSCISCLHVIPRFLTLQDQRAALLEMARVLAPGGTLLFNFRNAGSVYSWFYRGHAAAMSEMERILAEAGLRVADSRGKWFLSRKLVNRLPLPLGRGVAALDRRLERFRPQSAWDVFLVAVKEPAR